MLSAIGVLNPIPGNWTIRIPNATGLGNVQFEARVDRAAPSIQILTPSMDANPGNPIANIQYIAQASDFGAKVSLFYDNGNGGSGVLIAADLPVSNGASSFEWDTAGVPQGAYTITGIIDDGSYPLEFGHSAGRVLIGLYPPSLGTISDQTIQERQSVSFYAHASDPDPGRSLTYSLDAVLAGALINPVSGLFTWKATAAPGTYPVTVRVTDNGVPPLSATATFKSDPRDFRRPVRGHQRRLGAASRWSIA